MVNLVKLATALAAWSVIETSLAHPGEVHDSVKHKRELKMRDHLTSHSKRALDGCSNSLKARQLRERAVARRAETAKALREKRGLPTDKPFKRDLAELEAYEQSSHQQNNTGYTVNTLESTIFSANTSCVLTPEDTVGPYYVFGELIRSNVTEDQAGVPMHLEMQFIDTSTCEPITDLITDIWACNSTGVYSGIDTSYGEAGLDSTYLRGVQLTDADGVVQYDTIFPGHYTGRATHEHVVTHVNSTILSNGTYTGGTVNHIGQLFFDESLRSAVEATYPYNTNTQVVVSNNDDMWAPEAASAEYDPFVEYVMLGDAITDGLLVWISIGVNMTANYTDLAYIASYWTADGGEINEDDPFYTSMGSGASGNSTNTTSSAA